MKSLSVCILLCILVLDFISCKKDYSGSENAAISIIGKWNIVNDSVVSGMGTIGQAQNYIGTSGDYFDFRADGNVYIKENTSLDTLSYKLLAGNEITITSFGLEVNNQSAVSDITSLTAHKATISAPIINTPGGLFARTVNLAR